MIQHLGRRPGDPPRFVDHGPALVPRDFPADSSAVDRPDWQFRQESTPFTRERAARRR